ncbi:hypothetical protein LEP1GSC125_0685 [Leptospira mayottensis 200901122]|uniref:Uncharacterized protein n=1 Tax=Leptospira mayottensis 200901122 TaxID=1193010 RepID=A0AA87SYR0_9LEPT|nr:hypothetical protein LEP1GSC125_0685 [Leptospira mayottensis 200901122]
MLKTAFSILCGFEDKPRFEQRYLLILETFSKDNFSIVCGLP